MTDQTPEPGPGAAAQQAEPSVREGAMAAMDGLEARITPTRQLLATWAVRVLIFALLAWLVVRWRGGEGNWLVTVVALYAVISLALAFVMRAVQQRSIAKHRARIAAAADDLDRALEALDD